MTEQDDNERVHVAMYTDYICPFCFIGHVRLEKLRDEFDLDVDWRFIEIHHTVLSSRSRPRQALFGIIERLGHDSCRTGAMGGIHFKRSAQLRVLQLHERHGNVFFQTR